MNFTMDQKILNTSQEEFKYNKKLLFFLGEKSLINRGVLARNKNYQGEDGGGCRALIRLVLEAPAGLD